MREALTAELVSLPAPRLEAGAVSLEQAIQRRRSRRSFADRPLELWQIGQLLWAAQGMTGRGLRAAPSAGATYPLELYLACAEGFFHYQPAQHALASLSNEDRRLALARAALGQTCVSTADVVLLFAAIYPRTTARYGERGQRYVHMDVGHAAQNVLLQAEALGLAAVPVGAFHDADLAAAAGLPSGQEALYMVPVGCPA